MWYFVHHVKLYSNNILLTTRDERPAFYLFCFIIHIFKLLSRSYRITSFHYFCWLSFSFFFCLLCRSCVVCHKKSKNNWIKMVLYRDSILACILWLYEEVYVYVEHLVSNIYSIGQKWRPPGDISKVFAFSACFFKASKYEVWGAKST